MPSKPYHSIRTFEGKLGRLWLWHTGESSINGVWQNTKIRFSSFNRDHWDEEDWYFSFEKTGNSAETSRVGPFHNSEVQEVRYEFSEDGCTWGERCHIGIVLLSGTIELDYKPPLRTERSFGNIFFRRDLKARHHEEFNYVPVSSSQNAKT